MFKPQQNLINSSGKLPIKVLTKYHLDLYFLRCISFDNQEALIHYPHRKEVESLEAVYSSSLANEIISERHLPKKTFQQHNQHLDNNSSPSIEVDEENITSDTLPYNLDNNNGGSSALNVNYGNHGNNNSMDELDMLSTNSGVSSVSGSTGNENSILNNTLSNNQQQQQQQYTPGISVSSSDNNTDNNLLLQNPNNNSMNNSTGHLSSPRHRNSSSLDDVTTIYTPEQLLDFTNTNNSSNNESGNSNGNKLSIEKRILLAIEYGYLKELKQLLDIALNNNLLSNSSKIDINYHFRDKSKSDRTLLHIASRYGHYHILQYLIEELHTNVNCVDKTDTTPLFLAAAHGHTECCQYLIMKGANVNMRDVFENYPLSIALNGNFFECAENLILLGADVNFKGKKGNTCLHDACEQNDWKKIEFLLKFKKNLNIATKNRFEETCLFSCLNYPTLLFKLLDKFNLEFTQEEIQRWLKMEDQYGKNLLQVCVENNFFISFCVLIYFIQNDKISYFLNLKDKMNGNTCLHLCIKNLRKEESLNSNNSTNTNTQPLLGFNQPLFYDANTSLFGNLNNQNNQLNQNNQQQSNLTNLLENNSMEMLKNYLSYIDQDIFYYTFLSSQEINIDEQNNEGDTALHLAMKDLKYSTIHSLIQLGGASIKIQNRNHVSVKKLAKEMNINLDLFYMVGVGGNTNNSNSDKYYYNYNYYTNNIYGSNTKYRKSNEFNQSFTKYSNILYYNSQMQCGIQNIDDFYCKLFDYINELQTNIISLNSNYDFKLLIANIVSCLSQVFEVQRKLLSEYCSTKLYFDEHLREHEKLSTYLEKLDLEYKATNKESLLEDLLFNLIAHIREHYLVMDRTLAYDVKSVTLAPLDEDNEIMLEFI
ncbi:hypothetical protein ABK040_001027 [Willaertia magna]